MGKTIFPIVLRSDCTLVLDRVECVLAWLYGRVDTRRAYIRFAVNLPVRVMLTADARVRMLLAPFTNI